MPTKRIHPDRVLTNAEYQRRWRERHQLPKEPDWNRVLSWQASGNPIPYEVSKALGVSAMREGDAKTYFESVEDVTAAFATVVEGLPARTQARIETRLYELLRRMEMHYDELLKESLPEERARLREAKQAAKEAKVALDAEREAVCKIRMNLDCYMTMEEFQLVRSCLHPDKQPADQMDRYSRAFEIFNRLKDTVEPSSPIETLREHGWEKVSPYYKGKR